MVEFGNLLSLVFSYIIAHIIVLCIYRLTFHPYAKYPGPTLAKLTSLYGAYHAYRGDIYLDIDRCHGQYGKFVRYGPNSLLVNTPNGFHDVYGNLRPVKKSKDYGIHGGNLIGIQDKAYHTRIRKIFQQGFSDVANREYEPKVIREIDSFIERITEIGLPEESTDGWSSPKNMSQWCTYLTTDVVSKVVFTTSWDLLTSTANRRVTEIVKTIVRLIGVLHFWPHILYHEYTAAIFLPHLTWSASALKEYALAVMASSRAAMDKDSSIKNVLEMARSMRDPDTGELVLTPDEVRRNTSNFIVAGSDTTASSLAATFFYLTHNPIPYAKVVQEVRSVFPTISSIRGGPTLNSCVYLRAAINETLRMSPVAAQPLWRETEPGGCIVDGDLIPAGLNVGAGLYTLHYNAEAFPDPYKFDIQRWIIDATKDEREEKDRIKQMSRSFAPFSVGPRNCIAKNFALMEMMLTMAHVIVRLDFEKVGTLGEGKGGEFEMKSYFTSYTDGPMVKFRTREEVI